MLFDNVIEQIQASKKEEAEVVIVKLGEVTSVTPGGRAYVKLYGDGAPSTKLYTYIDGYFPEAGDKVALLPQGKTYIILGKINEKDPVEIYARIKWVEENFCPIEYKHKLEDAADSSEVLSFSGYSLIPTSDDKDSLGSAAKNFKEIFIKKLTLDGESFTKIYQDRIFVVNSGTTYSLIAIYAAGTITLTPSTNDAWALGTSAAKLKEIWTGLFRGAWKSGQSTERQLSWNSSNALVPDTSESVDLGSSSLHFKDLYIRRVIGAFAHDNTNGYIAWDSAAILAPSATNLIDLGTAAKQFSKVYANEFYINGTKLDISSLTFDELLTKSGNVDYTLKLSVENVGASSQYELVKPSVNGKFDLGNASYKFRDIYAALLKASWGDGTRQLDWDSNHDIIPDTTNAINLGSASKQLNKIYAKEFYINGTQFDPSGMSVNKLSDTYGSWTRTLELTASSSGASITPSTNDTFNLGASNYKFNNVYASTFNGDLDGAIKDGNSDIKFDSSHNWIPSTTNFLSLGTANKQFKNVYGQNLYVNGTAVSSDRRKKEDISPLDWRYDEFFKSLNPVSFRYKDGTSGRKHTGFIAQEVEEAAEKAGLSDKDLAVVVKDPEGDYYLRYEEIIAIQTKIIKELTADVEALKAKNRTLEARLEKIEKFLFEN